MLAPRWGQPPSLYACAQPYYLDRCQTTMDSCFEKRDLQKNPHRVVIYLVDGAIHPWNNFGWNYYMINWNPFSPLQKSTKCSLSTPVGGLESLDSQRLSLTVFWCDSCPARKILVGTEKIKPHTFCNWVKIGSRTGQIYACIFSYWMHVGLFGAECAQQSWKWFALACI